VQLNVAAPVPAGGVGVRGVIPQLQPYGDVGGVLGGVDERLVPVRGNDVLAGGAAGGAVVFVGCVAVRLPAAAGGAYGTRWAARLCRCAGVSVSVSATIR
jgi:hypothetical protein